MQEENKNLESTRINFRMNANRILKYACDLAGFIFIVCAIMYVVLFWWNSLSDFIIDERYFDSKYFLIIGLIAGILFIFKSKKFEF